MKIGFYDSGIGGLSVLQTAMQMLPNEEFIYYADTDHVPYGEKTNEEILQFARRATDFLIAPGTESQGSLTCQNNDADFRIFMGIAKCCAQLLNGFRSKGVSNVWAVNGQFGDSFSFFINDVGEFSATLPIRNGL